MMELSHVGGCNKQALFLTVISRMLCEVHSLTLYVMGMGAIVSRPSMQGVGILVRYTNVFKTMLTPPSSPQLSL